MYLAVAAQMAETLPLDATAGGGLLVPPEAHAIVLLAHGNARQELVTETLHHARFATLHVDLEVDHSAKNAAGPIRRLAERLVSAADWIAADQRLSTMPVGIFGSDLAGGAALAAAATRPDVFRALVLRDGNSRASGSVLNDVRAATLLIVNSPDDDTIALNQETMTRVRGIAELEVVSGSPVTREDPETLAHVAQLTRRWFDRFLV
jgi:pimeloyl-ACP methyl ester carboxylesterase